MSYNNKAENLIENSINGKITPEEKETLFELINKEKDQEHITAWFYEKWNESLMKKPKSGSVTTLNELKSRLNITPDLYKSFEYININLKPNQKATFTKTTRKQALNETSARKLTPKPFRRLSVIEKVDTRIVTSWKDNKLIFNNEPFKSLLPKLERWYNVEIQLEDTTIYSYRYTGMFEKETVEQALEALKLATPFEYTIFKNIIKIINFKNK